VWVLMGNALQIDQNVSIVQVLQRPCNSRSTHIF
jgi:hypothetical protein